MSTTTSRRAFLGASGGCAAHLAFFAALPAPLRARLWVPGQERRVVAREPFARIEELGDGLWALVSTPLEGDFTTICNGGVIAGRNGVLIVEGLGTPDGARWLAARALELTGRRPTHALLTHYHGDHVNGVEGLVDGDGAPRLHATAATLDRVDEVDAGRDAPPSDTRRSILDEALRLDPAQPTTLDLGGRQVRLTPRGGHTASDVTVEVEEPSIMFCGDLVWNRMFPNYVDAEPSNLSRSVSALRRTPQTVYVPGHGPLADSADLNRYQALLDAVEAAARSAHESGQSAEEAAATLTLPDDLAEWTLFNAGYYARAIGAWLAELA